MIPIKFVRCEIRKPRYNPHPEKSTTNNSDWRQGLFLIFEDYNGHIFDYMPKWVELQDIMENSKKIEQINKELCKQSQTCNLCQTSFVAETKTQSDNSICPACLKSLPNSSPIASDTQEIKVENKNG